MTEEDEGVSDGLKTSVPPKVLEMAFGPAASEFGEKIRPVGRDAGEIVLTTVKSVKALLLPLKAMVWGADRIGEWLDRDVAKKLAHVEQNKLQDPDPRVAVPLVDALRYVGHDETIRDIFANLLANSMNRSISGSVHPAFIELAKQMNSLDAEILRYLLDHELEAYVNIVRSRKDQSGSVHVANYFSMLWIETGSAQKDNYCTSIHNLIRLGILEATILFTLTDKDIYDALEDHSSIRKLKMSLEDTGYVVSFERGLFRLTELGTVFGGIAMPKTEPDPQNRAMSDIL